MIPDDDPAGDWTAPGVYRCAPDVYRIPLPLPQDGLRAVNVYAIADGAGFTLVDSGWVLLQSRDLLVAALGRLGGGLGDVRRFLVTHSHRDHYTLAVTLRREFGCADPARRGREARPGGAEHTGFGATGHPIFPGCSGPAPTSWFAGCPR